MHKQGIDIDIDTDTHDIYPAIEPSVINILFKTWKVLQEMNYCIAKGLF